MAPVVLLLVALVAVLALGMVRAPLWAWAVSVGVLTLLATGGSFDPESWIAWLPFLALAVLSIPAVRRSLIIAPVFAQIRKILPKVSDTEAQALEAGTVGFDAELFSGTPDWDKLKSIPPIELSAEEHEVSFPNLDVGRG